MYILDINVVSELMRPRPEPRVESWVRQCPPQEIRVTSITVAEVKVGILQLPTGSRRDELETSGENIFAIFRARTLGFSVSCARNYAERVSSRRKRDVRWGSSMPR